MTGRRILLIDLDGTVCRGDEQVHEYARLVGAGLDDGSADQLTAAVAAFLDSTDDAARAGVLADAQDGYQAVEAVGRRLGATGEQLHEAFGTTRAMLHSGELAAEAPDGIVEFLGALPGNVEIVLATNSPAAGLPNLLDRLGLTNVLHEVSTDVGKPEGLSPLLDRLLAQAGAQAEATPLLSVGDIWENDLRVPLERGCQAAYVDRFNRRQGPAHARADRLEGLYDFIREWAGAGGS